MTLAFLMMKKMASQTGHNCYHVRHSLTYWTDQDGMWFTVRSLRSIAWVVLFVLAFGSINVAIITPTAGQAKARKPPIDGFPWLYNIVTIQTV